MNTATPIVIHEFSTGIHAAKTADGGWVSQGFSGDYINQTINSIPSAVQTAIRNREFAVAEGASRDHPAVIGREVSDSDGNWSVVAVVTRGKDDRGRSFSAYRYFLAEGLGNTSKIVAWLNAQRKARQFPVFDPFEAKMMGHPNKYWDTEPSLETLKPEFQALINNPIPILISYDQPCSPLVLDLIARQLPGNQLIAWAYKVEALEQPRAFGVIQPGSAKAEELLHKSFTSAPRTRTIITGEQAIKSAISGLISRDQVKPEQLQVIETALANPQIDSNYWQSLFDGKGANQAKNQGIYSPQMVRLLTLQAIAIPETLSEFLEWMGQRGKQDEHYDVSQTFQTEVRKSFVGLSEQGANLKAQIYQGTKAIIARVIKEPELIEPLVWLLKTDQGLWSGLYEQQFKTEINNDLILMARYVLKGEQALPFQLMDDPEWKKILNDLKNCWRDFRDSSKEKYESLAELFGELGDYKLAAFFYQISLGSVPKIIFKKVSKNKQSTYGIKLKKQVSAIEFILVNTAGFLRDVGGIIVPFWIAFSFMVFSFSCGILLGTFIPDREDNVANETENSRTSPITYPLREEFPRDSVSVTPFSSPSPSTATPATTENGAETAKAIESLINELTTHTSIKDRQQIQDAILYVLQQGSGNLNLTIDQVVKGDRSGKNSIKSYQERVMKAEGEFADGVITNKGETYGVLKCHVADFLQISVQRIGKCKILNEWREQQPSQPNIRDGRG